MDKELIFFVLLFIHTIFLEIADGKLWLFSFFLFFRTHPVLLETSSENPITPTPMITKKWHDYLYEYSFLC